MNAIALAIVAQTSSALAGAGDVLGVSTLETSFESLQVLPASLTNQLDTVTWGGAAAGITARCHLSTSTAPPPFAGAWSGIVGGVDTTTLRGFVDFAFGSATWVRYNFLRTNTASPGQQGAERFVFHPTTNAALRIEHDAFVKDCTSEWTSAPTATARQAYASWITWAPHAGPGLVFPPSFRVGVLDEGGQATTIEPLIPPGYPREGEPYLVPIGRWFRVAHEFDSFGGVRYLVDFADGGGEIEIARGRAPVALGRVDRLTLTGDFATAGDECHIDNLRISGADAPPFPPCPGDANADRVVDFSDLNLTLWQYGLTGLNLSADFDEDGDVDFTDLNAVLSGFGVPCTSTQ